jgi:hypothetical protein
MTSGKTTMNNNLVATSSKRSYAAVIGAAVTGSLLSFTSHAELRPELAPGGNFALENWSLTLPVDEEGGNQGRAQTLYPDRLSGAQGYTSPYFRTDTDGAMTFWAPANGALSARADYARAELRQMIDPSSNAVNWSNQGRAHLDARLRVLQVPVGNGLVAVGQIHAYEAMPLVTLYYQYDLDAQTGRLFARVKQSPEGNEEAKRYNLVEGVKLGQAFVYRLGMARNRDGVAEVAVTINGSPVLQVPLDPAWDSRTFYFKAGALLNSRSDNSEDGARVKFYRLATSHPAARLHITQLSALPQARVGTPYSVQLESRGGVGGTTWRLVSGFPPAGLTLSSDGVLSGEPQNATSIPDDFTAQIRDSNGNTVSKKFSIVINP